METRFETLEEELVAIDCMSEGVLVKYYGSNERERIENGVINWWRTQISENEVNEALLLMKELREEQAEAIL